MNTKSVVWELNGLIFFTDVDKASLFDGGPKSMIVVGFAQQSEIPIQLALGDGNMVFQPVEGNQVKKKTGPVSVTGQIFKTLKKIILQ